MKSLRYLYQTGSRDPDVITANREYHRIYQANWRTKQTVILVDKQAEIENKGENMCQPSRKS